MLSCMSELITTVAQDPQKICNEMIEAGILVNREIQEFIRSPLRGGYTKASNLVHFMTRQVKTSPSEFKKFMAILEILPSTEHIVGILIQSSYHQKFDGSLVEEAIRKEKEVN